MIKTVIFDLDDTLYSEIDYCKSGFKHVASFLSTQKGVDSDKAFSLIWQLFTTGKRENLFNQALELLNVKYDQDFILDLVKEYRTHKPTLTLPTDSLETLILLAKKYKLALLSDGFMPAQRLKAEALEITDFFEIMVFTEEIGRDFWKPSAVGYTKILNYLEVSPEHSVYVADNLKKDFIAPNKLGMHSIQLIRPEKVHQDLAVDETARPEKVINSLLELPEILKSF